MSAPRYGSRRCAVIYARGGGTIYGVRARAGSARARGAPARWQRVTRAARHASVAYALRRRAARLRCCAASATQHHVRRAQQGAALRRALLQQARHARRYAGARATQPARCDERHGQHAAAGEKAKAARGVMALQARQSIVGGTLRLATGEAKLQDRRSTFVRLPATNPSTHRPPQRPKHSSTHHHPPNHVVKTPIYHACCRHQRLPPCRPCHAATMFSRHKRHTCRFAQRHAHAATLPGSAGEAEEIVQVMRATSAYRRKRGMCYIGIRYGGKQAYGT